MPVINFNIPQNNQVRCQDCRALVHRSRIVEVQTKMVAHIDAEYTPVKGKRKVCRKCHRTKYLTTIVDNQANIKDN